LKLSADLKSACFARFYSPAAYLGRAGWLHTCGIGGGTALCWGANDGGQLGDGGTTERNAPAAISGSLNITQVASGQDFSCGVTADNTIYCWGKNDLGQLGDGTTTQRLSPVRVLP
jgi:hypothetical protein